MMRVRHVRIMITRVTRGMAWYMGGTMRRARRRVREVGRAREGGRMSVSDAGMTSEWRAHDAHAFMMRAHHARAMIAHMMRGVTSCADGAAQRGAMRRTRRGRLVARA